MEFTEKSLFFADDADLQVVVPFFAEHALYLMNFQDALW